MKLIITEEERSRIIGMHQNATSRQYLMEDRRLLNEEPQVAKMTVQIPTTKDKTGKTIVSYPQTKLIFTIFNQKGKNTTSLKVDGVKKIMQITLPDGTKLTPFKQYKDESDNIIGEVVLTDDKKIAGTLQTLIGTNLALTDYQKMPISYMDTLGSNTNAYAGPVSFIGKDVDAPQKP